MKFFRILTKPYICATHTINLKYNTVIHAYVKRIIDIDPALDLKISQVLRTKGYRDFQHFASISLENQLLAETENRDSWKIEQKYNSNLNLEAVFINNTDTLFVSPSGDIKTLEPPRNEVLSARLLWGQYYRFLPSKVAVRVLANMSSGKFPSYSDFIESSVASAVALQKTLNRIDNKERNEFGEKVSAGFPDGTQKSIRRYKEHFLLCVRKGNLKLDGMLSTLKFANIIIKDGEEHIGLTQYGRKFAELHNYVLDESKSPSLSKEEVQFLTNHIFHNLPDEADHINIALNLIESGTITRDALNLALRKYYERYLYRTKSSENVINTMRAGLLGRLFEMGLIERNKKGKYVSYNLTESGQKIREAFSASIKNGNGQSSQKRIRGNIDD